MSIISRLVKSIRTKMGLKSYDELSDSETFYAEYLRKKQEQTMRNNARAKTHRTMTSEYEDYLRRKQEQASADADAAADEFYSEELDEESGEEQGDEEESWYDPEIAKYYASLEIPYGSDLETIRKAWKQMLRKYHPDLHATDAEKQRVANNLVTQLNEAYQELRKYLRDIED